MQIARRNGDWVLEIAGMLDRLAHRRFIDDPSARPPWWTPFPTSVGYGLIAQEVIDIMRLAGVEYPGDGRVDFERLIARDTLIERPPQNLRPGLRTLAWGDDALDWFKRIFTSGNAPAP